MIYRVDLPYTTSARRYLQALRDLSYPIWLDSQNHGRWDILVANPVTVVSCKDFVTTLQTQNHTERHHHDPFDYLQNLLPERLQLDLDIPFVGGIVGFISYDFGRYIEPIATKHAHEYQLPDLMLGLYDWAVILDHEQQSAVLVSTWQHAQTKTLWPDLIQRLEQATEVDAKPLKLADWQSNLTEAGYAERFEQIQHYLRAGDCYQVNLAQRFTSGLSGDALDLYCCLRERAKAPFGAYIDCGSSQILSCSPEQFLGVDYPTIQTKPIKGTRPRGRDESEDQSLKTELSKSEKDQAENVMIVDLLRNDLSKVCRPWSVQVPELFAIESYENVHHMVSTVEGLLKEGVHPLEALWHCFPGGSITGAPKYHVMEIIEELEPNHRSIYCGSVLYIGYDWAMDSSITIRTILHEQTQLYCWAGGGIVMDSELGSEYQETFDKVRHLTMV